MLAIAAFSVIVLGLAWWSMQPSSVPLEDLHQLLLSLEALVVRGRDQATLELSWSSVPRHRLVVAKRIVARDAIELRAEFSVDPSRSVRISFDSHDLQALASDGPLRSPRLRETRIAIEALVADAGLKLLGEGSHISLRRVLLRNVPEATGTFFSGER